MLLRRSHRRFSDESIRRPIVLAAELGVQTQPSAKWDGWFPEPEQRISDPLILYRRTAVNRRRRD
jgi:hypothetical protein